MIHPAIQIHHSILCIPASAADAAAASPSIPRGLIVEFHKGNPVFSNGPKSPPRNPPNCIILDN